MPSTAGPRQIIYLCLVFHPDTSASSILFTDLFRRLSAEGVEIRVLTGFPSKDGNREVAALPRCESLDGIRIERCGLRLAGKSSLIRRALSYGSFLAHAGCVLLLSGRNATVVGGTDPPFTSIVLWLLSRLGKFTYQTILLDVYPDGLVGLGSLPDSSPLTRLWRSLNRRSYAAAERLIVIGRDMIILLQQRYGVDPARVTYVPHWGSYEAEAGGVRTDFLAPLGLQDKFVVQYSGNMGLWHDIESLVHAASLLHGEDRIHFLFIGKGRRQAAAQALSDQLGLSNITWLDFLPREHLSVSLSGCDVALISLRQGLEGVAVPSKLYGILASGRAIVAQVPRHSEVAYVLEEERCGVTVEPGDTAGLAAAIRDLASDGDAVRRMGENAARAYVGKYTIAHAVAALRQLWDLAPGTPAEV